jgi:integrase
MLAVNVTSATTNTENKPAGGASPNDPAAHAEAACTLRKSVTIASSPVPARKRGKRMSRRSGQNPSVRKRFNRTKGVHEYFFQYWVDFPGQEGRKRETEVIGSAKQMTRSEAKRKKLEFLSKLALNSSGYRIPSSQTFADAVRHYREVFAPRMLRRSTFSVADGHLKGHLEADWNDTPIEHINLDSVNEWIWKRQKEGLSWVMIKNVLRTMQRVLSVFSKDGTPPFSQSGLAIPERDKLQMKIQSRHKVSFSWEDAKLIANYIRTMDTLGEARRELYAVLFLLAAASGLRCCELLALKVSDVDFGAGTIRVEGSSDQRSAGKIGLCKNARAYRTVFLGDAEGQEAMLGLQRYLRSKPKPNSLIFCSKRGGPLRETYILSQGLHPALEALGLEKAGMHAFRRGCNRRWELAGVNAAVIRQQMGHSSAAMTALYTGEIPIAQIRSEFSMRFGNKIVVLENVENKSAA